LYLKPAPTDLAVESTNCFICGSSEKEEVARVKDFDAGYDIEWQAVKCKKCGFIYTDPRPTMECMLKYFYPEDYVCYQQDQLPRFTHAANQANRDYGMKVIKEEIEKLLENPRAGRILDVGCAHGQILEYLRKRTNWELVGVEPVASVAEEAKLVGAEIHVSTLENAQLPSNSFDVVLMSHVLEHVENPDRTVREVFRILKPEGSLLAFMPDHDGEDRKAFGNLWWGYHLPRHLYHFDYISISQLLEQRGFEIRDVHNARWPNTQSWNLEYQLRGLNLPDAFLNKFNRYNPALWPAAIAMSGYFKSVGAKHSGVMQVVARKSILWDSISDEDKAKRLRNENAMQKRQAIEALRLDNRRGMGWAEKVHTVNWFARTHRPLFKRLFEYGLKNLLTDTPTFWGADLAITYDCNYKCEHCFARSSLTNKSRKELTTEQWITVIKQLLDAGCVFFQMQGGEALVHADLFKLIAACEPERSVVNVISNGSLIGEEELQRFKELGVYKVEVSVDSAVCEEHAKFRGQTEEKASSILEHLKWVVRRANEIGLIGGMFTTVTTDSLWSPGVQKLIEYCRENRINQYFSVAIPAGAWKGRHDLLLDAVDREYLRQLLYHENTAFRDMTYTRALSYGPLLRRFFSHGCPAVKESLYFTAYGDVCPCPYTHISLGNALEEPIVKIRNRALKIPQYRDRVELCPISEDHSFIKKYLSQTYDAALPIDGKKLFGLID
jgi:MoaA/NifB/PqqE/SkfB family radical SAM enzyme/SAM-dependent methyltransferase